MVVYVLKLELTSMTSRGVLHVKLVDQEDDSNKWEYPNVKTTEPIQSSDIIDKLLKYLDNVTMPGNIYAEGYILIICFDADPIEFYQIKSSLQEFHQRVSNVSLLHWLDLINLFKTQFPISKQLDVNNLTRKLNVYTRDQDLKECCLYECLKIKRLVMTGARRSHMSIERFLEKERILPKAATYPELIIFDLETSTGDIKHPADTSEILQIGLVDLKYPYKIWEQYIKPEGNIYNASSRINHLHMRDGALCHTSRRGTIECKDVVEKIEGAKRFMYYLKTNYPAGVVLVAHNGDEFDFPIIKKFLGNYCNRYPIWCIDSMKAFQARFPEFQRHSQQMLLAEFGDQIREVHSTHDAIGDCINLKNLINIGTEELELTSEEFLGSPHCILCGKFHTTFSCI